ncbi:hypothetical protein DFQ28_003580 [Apophysomyces sp. BC1034]|nr:hypothetical protein DFQ30_003537 [Apophysomyces sp. BC1015]KAG0179033.1 hypothetical protein DFQ29_002713 [Apophysomyces sp. BC1021]KAG0189288.1 hypothetical protein DFQ28_003580 [Apophysomyces sp. BC1034]
MTGRLPWLVATRVTMKNRIFRGNYRRTFTAPSAEENPRGGGRGAQSLIIAGALLLSAASIAYYNSERKQEGEKGTTYDAYQNPFLFFAADVAPNEIKRSQEVRQKTSSNSHLHEAKQAGNEALDHAQAATQYVGESASQIGQVIRDTAGNLKDETNTLATAIQHRAADLGEKLKKEVDEAKEEVDEIKNKADKFRTEHHLKSGSRPPEDVLSHIRDPDVDTTILGKETNEWGKRKVGEAADTLANVKQQVASEVQDWKESAQQKADQVHAKWHDVKEDVAVETKRRGQELDERAQQAASQAESSWQDLKNDMKDATQKASQVVQSTADQAKDDIHRGWVDLKDDADRLKKEGEEQAREGLSHLKQDALWVGDKVGEAKDWIRGEVEDVKSKAEHEQKRWADSVRRGEGWAEEEADNLRPTRTHTTLSDRASEERQRTDLKLAEEVVHEAGTSKL